VGVAIVAFFVIVNFLESTHNKLLSPEKSAAIKAHLEQERGYQKVEK